MYFSICSSDYIAYHSDAQMRAILTHSNTRDALNLSIENLVTTGATQSDFTRTIALVVREISDLLEQKKPHVAHRFAANLAGAAVSVFLSYFTERQRRLAPGYRPNRTADAIDPLSLCAFVGDLFSVRILTFDEFDDCVSALLSCTPSAYLFKCLHALIARGSGPAHPKMTSNYLLQCIASIKNMCAKHRNVEFLEAPKLITLIYDIISRTHGGTPQYKIDRSLDLDTALMDSSISPLADWLYASGSNAPHLRHLRAILRVRRTEDTTERFVLFVLLVLVNVFSSILHRQVRTEEVAGERASSDSEAQADSCGYPSSRPHILATHDAHGLTTTTAGASASASGTAHATGCTSCPVYELFPRI